MKTAGTDEVGAAPGAVEGRNIRGERDNGGGEIGKRVEMDRWIEKHFTGLDSVSFRGFGDSESKFRGIGNKAKHDFGASFVGDDVGRAAAMDRADVECGLAEDAVGTKRNGADVGECIEQRVDRGM